MSKTEGLEKTEVTQDLLAIFKRFRGCGMRAIVQHSDDKTAIHFKGGMKKRITIVSFEVDRARDLYNVEFGKIFRHDYKVVSRIEGVFWDQLIEIFERETGFYILTF